MNINNLSKREQRIGMLNKLRHFLPLYTMKTLYYNIHTLYIRIYCSYNVTILVMKYHTTSQPFKKHISQANICSGAEGIHC
jgi:hypothetical protein